MHGIFGDQRARTVTLKRTGKKMICGGCGAVNHAIYDSKMRKVRDLPCGDMRVYLKVEIRRVITHEEYAAKKAEFIGEKKAIQSKLEVFSKNVYDRFTPVIDFFTEASHVGKLAEVGNPGFCRKNRFTLPATR